jgi:hypothetical protein
MKKTQTAGVVIGKITIGSLGLVNFCYFSSASLLYPRSSQKPL